MAYSTSTVAHAWAHNLDKCHSGSSVYQDHGIFKSYSTAIAQKITMHGQTAYILNDHTFSPSTTKHQSEVRCAVPVDAPKFIVDIENWGASEIIYQNRWRDDPESDRMYRIRFGMYFIIAELNTCLAMKTARKLNSQFSRNGYNDLVRWLEFTKDTTVPKMLRVTDVEFRRYLAHTDFRELNRAFGEKNTVRMVRRFLRMLHTNCTTEEICDAINGAGTYAAWEKRQQSIRKAQETYRRNAPEREAQAEARRQKTIAEASYVQRVIMERGDEGRRDLWHEGYRVTPNEWKPTIFYGGNVLLRMNGNYVETSKGIKVAKSECRRLWDIVSRLHNAGKTFERNIDTVHATLSNFTISRYQDDIMIAGCHAIAYKEMENVARQLGFI